MPVNSLNSEMERISVMRRFRAYGGVLLLTVLIAAVVVVPARAQDGRPVLPNAQTLGSENFLIHYTLTGPNAVSPIDTSGSGVPDYVELVRDTLETVWRVQIDEMGWPPPPPDRGEGGDTRIDVYLTNVLGEGYAGYVDTAGGFIGDNPATPERERRAAYAFMVLDNDYAEVDIAAGETPEGLLRATVAHEFNHVIQAGIDDQDLHFWLYEATASWMEDEIYGEVKDVLYYLDSVFKNPDICLVAEVARGDDLHWYGNWLLLRLMSERYGPDIVRDIWINMRQFNGFGAIDAALAPYGSSLENETRDFAVANLLRAYEEGHLYPTVTVESQFATGTYTPANGVQSLGADYMHLIADGMLSVRLLSADAPLTVRAVGVRGAEADMVEMRDGVLSINSDRYEYVFLVIHKDERIASENECTFASYTLEIAPSSAAPSPVAQVWPADNFVSPFEQPVSAGGDEGSYRPPGGAVYPGGGEYATIPEQLPVAFDVILPVVLPPGYAFDYAYIMTDADFGDNAPYYVPAGGDSANYDYLDEQGNWLSIAQSPSPYATLNEWLDDVDYDTPGEIRQVSGVEVLVEDLSDSSGVWISATLILNNLFIVVDGDRSETDVILLVESLIAAASAPQPAQPEGAPPAQPQGAPAPAPLPGVSPPPSDDSLLGNLTRLTLMLCACGLCAVGLLVLAAVAVVFLRS